MALITPGLNSADADDVLTLDQWCCLFIKAGIDMPYVDIYVDMSICRTCRYKIQYVDIKRRKKSPRPTYEMCV